MELEQYSQVKRSVKSLLDIDLDGYKDEQMRRRLDSWLVRAGAPDWNDYFRRLRSDQQELSRFRNYLTINVSSFFRDSERWQSLAAGVLPRLLKECQRSGAGRLAVWSAGCSIGPEPYSLAMLLEDLSPYRQYHILATDLDRGALTKARAGGPYHESEVQNLSAVQRAHYLRADAGKFWIQPSLGKKIEFREHNMISDPFPAGFDLIVCRNVVIYFTAEVKENLYRRFYNSLRPGGVLFVGATEIIPQAGEIGFRSDGISFYRREA